ncbi:MAG: hypothetical protein U0790_24575 [Isosphaeraceae bacterium]
MRSLVVSGLLVLLLSGCGQERGNGLWDLRVGGRARLVSADESSVTLRTLAAPKARKKSRSASRPSKADELVLPAGTRVVVLAIDGDDARVEIKDGPRAGAVSWVECARLVPEAR